MSTKSSVGREISGHVEKGDQGVARIRQGAQEALQTPCERCQLQRLLGGHHEIIQEPEVQLLHLEDHYLLGGGGGGNHGTVGDHRYGRISGVMRGSPPRVHCPKVTSPGVNERNEEIFEIILAR